MLVSLCKHPLYYVNADTVPRRSNHGVDGSCGFVDLKVIVCLIHI